MFPTTRWTLVLSAREGIEKKRAALEELLTTYWRPLYAYVRYKGLDAETAKDAVQGLILHLLERDFLERLDPAKGRLRGFLKKAMDNFLVNLHERETAQRRGGDVPIVPLDLVLAERDIAAAPQDPLAAFEREWAVSVMERAL